MSRELEHKSYEAINKIFRGIAESPFKGNEVKQW